MRQKSDSCFSLCSSRTASLWRQGYPPVQYGARLLQFNEVKFRNNQNKFFASNSTYVQGMYLVSDEKYIILENLKLDQYSLQNKKCLSISTNLDSIHMTASDEQIDQLYEYIKQYTIQDKFEKKYKTIKLMGKGSFAKVFQVMQFQNKQHFAAKIFNKLKMEVNEENDISLWKEIGIMRQMNHKNVIKLHEVFEDEKKVYLVLDYLKGGDLLANLSSQVKVYDEQIVLKLMKNVLEGLQYIHKLKILHRDIKPDNLILRNHNDITDPVLVDFGLADFYSETGDYLFKDCGSIGYVAPEMLRNQKYDYKVDIFSLGVICYLLMTGQQAFEGESTKRIFDNNRKCNIDYSLLAKCNVSDEAKDFCQFLLAENPLKRPDAETALKHKWLYLNQESLHKIPLRINKKPTIIRRQNEFIHSQSPLWVITSVKCISEDSDDIFISRSQNVRDRTIDEILSSSLSKFKLNSEYDLEDDIIEEDERPVVKVQNHQLLVKQRSLP